MGMVNSGMHLVIGSDQAILPGHLALGAWVGRPEGRPPSRPVCATCSCRLQVCCLNTLILASQTNY